jgi:voltage-gated potassium channel
VIKRSKILWRWISTILIILIFFLGFLFLIVIAERSSPYATINNFFDAIYYGFVTLAAVGYGDFVPVTLLGKILALFLVLTRIIHAQQF